MDMIDFFTRSRFGMFVHFGLYSIPAGVWKGREQGRNHYAEWIRYQALWPDGGAIPDGEYRALASEFNPAAFDADAWAEEIRNAGMKYVVITAKHHDGFALWDSRVSGFNIVKATPFRRDLIRELKEACDRRGIVLGAYYSHWLDWEFPGGGLPLWPEIPEDPPLEQPSDAEFEHYFTAKCLPQVTELLDGYGIRLFWFDNWCKCSLLTEARLEKLIDLVHSRGGIVNSRIGVTWNHSGGDAAGIDYLSMGDNQFPDKAISRPWETSGTFNESWGYHRLDYRWKTTDFLLKCLISNASRNGNYQLNIGPHADGSIPAPSVRRLREIGAWLAVNGESVYNTACAPQPEPGWGRLTLGKDGALYAHVFENHPACQLVIEAVSAAPRSARILETDQRVPFHHGEGRLTLQMPPESVNSPLNVVKIEF